MTRYGFALRLARQDALRAKGRTALVLGMIGLPICAVVALAVLRATSTARDRSAGAEPASAAESAVLALIVAMIVLEVVLLAGPAFVVDVRRRRRDLALVAASGGEGRHLRAVVLASGLLLGGTAAVGGAALGIAAAALAAWTAEARGAEPLGPFTVPWLLVAATMLVGAGSGLLAALVPAAQAARTDVVAVLSGRREAPAAARRGWPVAGGVLVVAGVALCLEGVRKWREFGAAIGAAAIIIGLVLTCPWLVGAAGRLARRLPLPLRLAVRDAGRNRARTAPAVAAIMAAVAGITALAIGGASDFRQEQIEYQATLPMGSALVRPPLDRADAVGEAVRRDLPGVPVVTLKALPGPDGGCVGDDWSKCPAVTFAAERDENASFDLMDNVVGGAREARMVLGRDDPAVTAALDAGKVVLFRAAPLAGGTTTAKVFYWEDDEEHVVRTVEDLPAVVAAGDPHVRAIVPPRVAERIGLPVRTEAFGVDRADHRVTEAEQARLDRTLDGFTRNEGSVYVERGFTGSFGKVTLMLAAVAAALALGGSLIATGLASADALPDLATLGAIGARPRTRRLLTMGRAAFIAALGCWLGIAGGFVPGIAVTRPLTSDVEVTGAAAHGAIVDVPWTLLLAVGIGIPLLVALVAGAFTRSRLPMARRLAR
ncbi:FtsX-like permease family protein [Actinomadura chokoriensis]|uniref:FtsX-like permease family protein n=1 Tax=Actinomadura chokoriensis TaxID=454156 RepID=UPI0031F794D3